MATIFSSSFQEPRARAALLIFCRAPRLGEVKTRLAAAVGAEAALRLYRAMLRDCFDLGRALAPDAVTLACFTPAASWEQLPELNGLWSGAHLAQRGGDLGARMLNALADARARGFGRALIIGSDAPDLPPDYLRQALALLRRDEVVVGPGTDGGFVLLGAARPLPDAVFDGIVWSREDVCARLQRNLQASELSFSVLPQWSDVDEIADVEALGQRLARAPESVAAATRRELARLRPQEQPF